MLRLLLFCAAATDDNYDDYYDHDDSDGDGDRPVARPNHQMGQTKSEDGKNNIVHNIKHDFYLY